MPSFAHFQCRICQTLGDFPVVRAREMMYGLREPFEYVHCVACGCPQIHEIPVDLGRHYPPDYYSMAMRDEPPTIDGVKGALVRWYCATTAVRPRSILAIVMRRFLPMPTDFSVYGHYLLDSHLRHSSEKILDVGCGSSPALLAAIYRCGFRNVEGIDPFVAEDLQYHGVHVYKREIEQMPGEGKYGLVMFHHSLEHTPDPVSSLRAAASLLRNGGTCLV